MNRDVYSICATLGKEYISFNFGISLHDTSSHIFYRTLWALPLYKFFFEFSAYPAWLGKIFKFMGFRLLENTFATQKIESRCFYSCSGQNFPLSSYHHHFFQAAVFTEKSRGRKLCIFSSIGTSTQQTNMKRTLRMGRFLQA